MHPYITDCIDRKYGIAAIAFLAAFLAYGCHIAISALEEKYHIRLPWYAEVPGFSCLFGVVYYGYRYILWKARYKWFKLSAIPNLNGSWFGELRSSHDKDQSLIKTYDCMLIIKQNWEQMLIEFRTETSTSFSDVAAIMMCEGKTNELRYEYFNKPKELCVDTMHPHGGTVYLEISSDIDTLNGGYYTNRKPPTCGEMTFRRVSKRREEFHVAKSKYIAIARTGMKNFTLS